MKLKIFSHASDEETVKEVNSRSDLLELAKNYPAVYRQVAEAPSTEDGLNFLAQYLSRNHMDAKVEPDRDKIQDDFNVSGRQPKGIKNLDDAAKLLESDDENVDIPDQVVIEGATHRW